MTLQWGTAMADRFTEPEAEALWALFKPIDAALQAAEQQTSPGYQGEKSPYYLDQIPTELSIDRFIADWSI